MRTVRRWTVPLLALVAIASIAGCSSTPAAKSLATETTPTVSPSPGTTGATTAPTSETSAAAAEYTTLVAPVDATEKTFKAANTDDQLQSAAGPFADALQTWSNKLAEYTWPAVAKADVSALISDIAPIVGQLEQLSTEGAESIDISQLTTAASKISTATVLVRKDLGLPQTSS